jgi:uncharacterized membrane protein
MPRKRIARRLALALHAGLATTLAFSLATVESAPAVRVTFIVLALLPLVATLRGLIMGRGETLRWLALALVLYTGLGAVEVIARSDAASIAVLFLALLELALVLSLVRAPRSRAPHVTGES